MKINDFADKIQIWGDWQKSYKHFVPKFINEAIKKTTWQSWDNDVFTEFFMRSNNQCVSSLTQGYFTNEEKEEIKNNWHTIAPLLKEIALSQDLPLWNVYAQIQKQIRVFTYVNRKAATYRLIAGLQPNLLCTVVNERALKKIHDLLDEHIEEKLLAYQNNWFRDSHHICKLFSDYIPQAEMGDLVTYPWQTKVYFEEDHEIENNDMSETITPALSEIANLLKYKKQIILQGPPGTGKTKLAKEIAAELTSNQVVSTKLTKEIIISYMTEGLKFPSAKDKIEYEVDKITSSGVSVIASTKNLYVPLFHEIIKSYNDKVWEKEGAITKGNDSYSAAISKYIYLKQKYQKSISKENDQVKIIQFHPSYNYEDFVRGIVAKPNEDSEGIIYKAENKLFGLFASAALDNYLDSKGESRHNLTFQHKLTTLTENIRSKIDSGLEYSFGDKSTAQIIAIMEEGFLYTFPKRSDIKYKILFNDIEKVYNVKEKIEKPIDLRDLESEIGLAMKGKYPYYYMILRQLEMLNNNEIVHHNKAELKNFVIIIDEINRANLSAVLGELIYGLEYRGEAVESMYSIERDNKITLPPNLYLIGTMNTADRSVGYIDYAIRRRFAFVDIHPEDLSPELGGLFDQKRFLEVAAFFDHETHLSKEFDAKDVQLGHSYFIDKTNEGGSMSVRLKYEIKPILLEYVKDGILIGENIVEKIEAL